jgi:hypothetical protein
MIVSALVVAIAFGPAGEPVPVQVPTPEPAPAQDVVVDPAQQEAETHFKRGVELERSLPKNDPQKAAAMLEEARREYMIASERFGALYAERKKPAYLFARAQSYRRAGRCDLALPDYDAVLEMDLPPEAAQDVRANRKRCTAQPSGAAPPPARPPSGSVPPKAPDKPRRQWVRDPAGGVLVALGSAVGITGVLLTVLALPRDDSAASAGNEDEYINRKDAARVQHRVGIAACAVGGAMLVAGVTRWGVLAARERKRRMSAGVSGSSRGASVSVSIWF